jgi:uncharacterized protein with FMN-binding domain
MKVFWIKVVNLLLVIGLVFSYNTVLASRQQSEEIARLQYELENAQLNVEQEEEAGQYTDGTYTGSAQGFGGEIEVEVNVESGKISTLTILSAKDEDTAYLDAAKGIIDTILENQSADVDTISGATFSSTGIKEATKQALEKAEK